MNVTSAQKSQKNSVGADFMSFMIQSSKFYFNFHPGLTKQVMSFHKKMTKSYIGYNKICFSAVVGSSWSIKFHSFSEKSFSSFILIFYYKDKKINSILDRFKAQ